MADRREEYLSKFVSTVPEARGASLYSMEYLSLPEEVRKKHEDELANYRAKAPLPYGWDSLIPFSRARREMKTDLQLKRRTMPDSATKEREDNFRRQLPEHDEPLTNVPMPHGYNIVGPLTPLKYAEEESLRKLSEDASKDAEFRNRQEQFERTQQDFRKWRKANDPSYEYMDTLDRHSRNADSLLDRLMGN